ncbi:Sensory/regulatory protein RpfC [subsurface metagenome]
MLDEIRLRQILLNLVGNAIKFTERGHVRVVAECFDTKAEDIKKLRILVEDTGIGIPKEAQGQIFESCRQQDEQDIRKYGGTGLGLAITKRLVELMNGGIEVESIPGKGSTFIVTLENALLAKKDLRDHSEFKYKNIQFDEATILVVDDIESNRELVKGFLYNSGLKTIEAKNGQEAIGVAQQKHPDLILMDIRMPTVDGYEATRFLKQTNSLKDVPIVALTASLKTKTQKKNTLFDGYLIKPITKAELYKELIVHLKFHEISLSPSKEEKPDKSKFSKETQKNLPKII